jgi:hypothetical protein
MEQAAAALIVSPSTDVIQQPVNFYGCHVIIEVRRDKKEKKADGGE